MTLEVLAATALLILSPFVTVQAQVYDTTRGPGGAFVAPENTELEGSVLLNGSFEENGGAGTNILDDWIILNQEGFPTGDWYAQTGTSSPVNALVVDAPTDGVFAAMTDTNARGSHILYQDFGVPSGGALLSLDIFISNTSYDFSNPPTFDVGLFPNQQARVDIMDPSAPVDDVGAGVLLNMFATLQGDPLLQPYQTIMADLGPWAGTTVRLRIGEADNLGILNVGVDRVIVQGTECMLIIGDGAGEAPFFGLDHLFTTQLDDVVDSYGVTLDFLPEFVLPAPGLTAEPTAIAFGGGSTVAPTDIPSWMWDGRFTVQVLMWNPELFPELPEQCTSGLAVQVHLDGSVTSRPFGADVGGMGIWHETSKNADGQQVIRFPFSIPGIGP